VVGKSNDFQQALLHELLGVEEHRAGCSRVVKRLKRGERVPIDAVELRGTGESLGVSGVPSRG
jgi:hypothetical protein